MKIFVLVAIGLLGASAELLDSDLAVDADLDGQVDAHISRIIAVDSIWGAEPCATKVIPGFDYAKGFAEFCKRHEKIYKEGASMQRRFACWTANHNCVHWKNAESKFHFKMRDNHMADYTAQEFKDKTPKFTRRTTPPANTGLQDNKPSKPRFQSKSVEPVTGSFDWRTKGVETPVTYQNNCGDCYAHAAKNVAEAAWIIAGNNKQILSSQQLNDCGEMKGCDGGNPSVSLEKVKAAGGFCTENAYPDTGNSKACGTCKPKVQIKKLDWRSSRAEEELAAAVRQGPVAIAINGSPATFKNYDSGVYDDPDCNKGELSHAVTVMGWGTEKGVDYWLIKNSWSTVWGQGGYGKLARGKNTCFLTTEWSWAIGAPAAELGFVNEPTEKDLSAYATALSGKKCTVKPSGDVGVCMATTSCKDLEGRSVPKFCPGMANNVQCCVMPRR